MKTPLLDILEPIAQLTLTCFVIGSQRHCLRELDRDRDVDLVFLVDNIDCKLQVIAEMQRIQNDSVFLFHPTFLTKEQFRSNPAFSDLVIDGVQLW